MSILTVYFCGTGSHRFDDLHPNFWDGELVSTLASNTQGREFADWIIIDGPGSGNLQADEMFVENKAYDMTGTLFGKGWDENVGHALQIIKGRCDWQRQDLTEQEYNQLKAAGVPIKDLEASGSWFWRRYSYGRRDVTPQQLQEQIIKTFRKDGVIPTQVNMVGWSRGGISCHMLANAMANDAALKHIPVNIFAIDPVPGIFNFQDNRVKLAANVKEYVAFYARDERSKGFACVIPQAERSTRMSLYPMPGRHATLVGNAAADGDSGEKALAEPGLIVRHFAQTCLTRWGTSLSKRLQLSEGQLKAYHKVLNDDDLRYQAMRKHSYTLITEGTKEDRAVSLGSKDVPFSSVQGSHLSPKSGLATPLEWHDGAYKDIC